MKRDNKVRFQGSFIDNRLMGTHFKTMNSTSPKRAVEKSTIELPAVI